MVDYEGGLVNLKDNLIYSLNESVQINRYIYIGISDGGEFWVRGGGEIYMYLSESGVGILTNSVVGI